MLSTARHCHRKTPELVTTVQRDIGRFAGGAGVVAATCAALCCAGAPIIVSILAATGLGAVAKLSMGIGTALLLGATVWNARLPRACDVPEPLTRLGA